MNAVITVEDFGGADKVKEFYDEWNKECRCELQDCWNEEMEEWNEDYLNEHIIEAIANQDELPLTILKKLNSVDYENDEDWTISDEVKNIAKESCNNHLDKEDDDWYRDYEDDEDYDEENSSDEEKACHEITEVLKKYNVEIRGDELGGVWIGHYKIN